MRPHWRHCFDLVVTDDRARSAALGESGTMAFAGPFDTDLGPLVRGPIRAGRNPRNRSAWFAGTAVADLSLAALVDTRAPLVSM